MGRAFKIGDNNEHKEECMMPVHLDNFQKEIVAEGTGKIVMVKRREMEFIPV